MIKLAALRTSEGKIYTGKRHAHIFPQEPKGVLRCAEQGFITDDGIFVDRVTALRIAIENNQIIKKHGDPEILYSEDVIPL
jgi:hypothetical protein